MSIKSRDFNGTWAGGAIITVSGSSVTVDMSVYKRPAATGSVLSDNSIQVNFPDDKSYTGTLTTLNNINWGANNNWGRIFKPRDFNGTWAGGAIITVSGNSITIDMSVYNRPAATGTVLSDNSFQVNFPDDRTYTGTLTTINNINWGSANNNWARKR